MKLVDDTLKNSKGKWSRKSITALVSFLFALNYATTIPYLWYMLNDNRFEFNVTVFSMSITLTSVCLGLSVWDKSKGGSTASIVESNSEDIISTDEKPPSPDECEDGTCDLVTKDPV
jgi:hypothetical protein